jgi:iron complex transport system ATP-binding protein
METTIELKNLTTGYKLKKHNKVISSEFCASLKEGQMTCMLGPNGAGKSTLLRTLSGFQPALSGEIMLNHRPLSKYTPKELSKLISVVLTDNSGIKNMTVWEVVAMGRSPYTGFWGKLVERDKKMVEKCLSWVGITEHANRKMQTLSDGERQKVMIAKAIAQETPVIFLDEPTAYLDYPSKVSMMLLLHRLAKALKKTIFLSTHDLEHALQVADNIWLVDRVKGLTTGMPEDLCREGRVEEYFKREGLQFNPETSTFSVLHETAREVIVDGATNSLEYKLVCRALRRNAIQPVKDAEDKNVIVRALGDGKFRLLQYGKEIACVDKIEHIIGVTSSTLVKTQINAVRHAAQLD